MIITPDKLDQIRNLLYGKYATYSRIELGRLAGYPPTNPEGIYGYFAVGSRFHNDEHSRVEGLVSDLNYWHICLTALKEDRELPSLAAYKGINWDWNQIERRLGETPEQYIKGKLELLSSWPIQNAWHQLGWSSEEARLGPLKHDHADYARELTLPPGVKLVRQ